MTDDVINPENSRYFNYLRRYSLNRWTIGVSTSCAGTQIQLSRVLEERFKARDLRCPQAALHCASSLSKWQSGVLEESFISMSARLFPGCSRCPSSLSKWQSGVLEERFISMSARLSPGCSPMCQNPPLYLSKVDATRAFTTIDQRIYYYFLSVKLL